MPLRPRSGSGRSRHCRTSRCRRNPAWPGPDARRLLVGQHAVGWEQAAKDRAEQGEPVVLDRSGLHVVEEIVVDRFGHPDGHAVGQHDDAEVGRREHGERRRGALVEAAGMTEAQPAGVVVTDVQAVPVEAAAADRGQRHPGPHVRQVRLAERGVVDDRGPVPHSAGQLQDQPAGQVQHVRAGPRPAPPGPRPGRTSAPTSCPPGRAWRPGRLRSGSRRSGSWTTSCPAG